MKSYAYHEAAHTIVAQHLGFPVEYTSIEEGISPFEATKTLRLKDYFDEDALLLGSLEVKGKESLSRNDYKIFYGVLMIKLAGYTAIELSGMGTLTEDSHYDEDRAFALNILHHLGKEKANKKYEKMKRIVEKILVRRWDEVETLANRLMEERTVYL